MSDSDVNDPDLYDSDPDGTGDPRLDEPDGNEGMPAELVDTPTNMPGDQPIEDDPPTVSEVHGRGPDG